MGKNLSFTWLHIVRHPFKLLISKGQTLLEVTIVLGGAIFVVTTITAVVLAALVNAQFSKNQKVGSQFAQEGMEVVRRFRDADFAAFNGLSDGVYCLDKNDSQLRPRPIGASNGCPAAVGAKLENVDTYARLVTIERNASSCSGGSARFIKATVTVEWSDGRCTTPNPFCRSVEITSCLSNVSSYYAVLLPSPTPTPTGQPTPTMTPVPTPTPIICTCDTPGGVTPNNHFICTDGDSRYCAANERCTTSSIKPAWPCQVLTPNFPYSGIVAYWKMDETSGNIQDVFGTNEVLTPTSITYANPSLANTVTSLGFNGSTSLLSCTDASCGGSSKLDSSNSSSGYSFGGWIYLTSYGSTDFFVLSKDGGSGGPMLVIDTLGRIRANLGNSGCTNDSGEYWLVDTVLLTTWTHLMVTVSSGNPGLMRIYKNGSPISTRSPASEYYCDESGNFEIGKMLNGRIDEFGVWQRELSGTEVNNVWTNPNGVQP